MSKKNLQTRLTYILIYLNMKKVFICLHLEMLTLLSKKIKQLLNKYFYVTKCKLSLNKIQNFLNVV